MYRRILLAYDGSVEGRTALREGALLAKRVGAEVYLLSVVRETAGVRLAEGAHPGPVNHLRERYRGTLEEGLRRLGELGFSAHAKLVVGEPAQEIAAYAHEIAADLVVVGHRRQSLLERWWSGSSGAYLSENLDCSLLIGRTEVSPEDFRRELDRAGED